MGKECIVFRQRALRLLFLLIRLIDEEKLAVKERLLYEARSQEEEYNAEYLVPFLNTEHEMART